MQRWIRKSPWGATAATRLTISPAYVDLKISSLRQLARSWR
jgi:hypothetical protein